VARDVLRRAGMPHPIRVVFPRVVYEFSARTIQGRFLLRPGPEANELILGVLGRALDLFPAVRLHAIAFLSNHYHGLASSDDPELLSAFRGYLNSNLARELGRLHQWSGPFWGQRSHVAPVLDDAAMVERLHYVLSQGTKEGLVASPREVPWVSSLPAMLGAPLEGVWFARNAEYEDRRAGRLYERYTHATRYPVPIAPLPCWANLSEAERASKIESLVARIEKEGRLRRAATGRGVLGVAAILAEEPHAGTGKLRRSPAPLCHTTEPSRWLAYRRFIRSVVADFRAAAAALKERAARGWRAITARDRPPRVPDFPPGTFPPRLPFVRPPEHDDLPLTLDPFADSLERRIPAYLRASLIG
jgi:hypothetical protein